MDIYNERIALPGLLKLSVKILSAPLLDDDDDGDDGELTQGAGGGGAATPYETLAPGGPLMQTQHEICIATARTCRPHIPCMPPYRPPVIKG